MTETQIVTALDAELERLFDARVGAASSSELLQLQIKRVVDLKVTQGAGDGSMFGTDETNNGGILARETMRNNLTAEWVGDTVAVVTNVAGGKVSLSAYAAAIKFSSFV